VEASAVLQPSIVVSDDVKGGSIWKRNGTVKLWDNPDFMLASGALAPRDAGSRAGEILLSQSTEME